MSTAIKYRMRLGRWSVGRLLIFYAYGRGLSFLTELNLMTAENIENINPIQIMEIIREAGKQQP